MGIADIKAMHVPVLKCSHGYSEVHSFKANYRRKDLIVVHSLNLGEAFPLGVRGPGNQQKHLEYIAGSG